MDNKEFIKMINHYMLARGRVPAEQFEEQLNSFRANITRDEIFQAIQVANKKLIKYNMMIRNVYDPDEMKNYYVMEPPPPL